jgi:hypothetical protein
MKAKQILTLASLLSALLLTACATSKPTMTEQQFGDSVRQMIRAQTYDAATLSGPSEDVIDRTDGPLLEGALESYRGNVADPASVSEPITISVGP